MGNKTLAGIAGAGLVGIVALVAVLITIAAQGAGPEPDHTRDTGLEAEAGIGRQSPDTRPSNPAVAVTLEKAADGAEPPDTGLEAEPGTVFQSPDTHPNPDAPIIAAQMGLTLEKATAVVVWQDEWGEYAAEVRGQYGDQISAIWADAAPGETLSTRGYIQFIGEVPSGLETMEGVTLMGDGAISMADHWRRGELAAEALVALGYLSFVTYYDRADKVLRAEVQIAPRATPVTKAQIVTKLQELLVTEGLTGRAAQIGLSDLDLIITEGTGSFIKGEPVWVDDDWDTQ